MMDINTLLALDLAEYTTALEALADQMMLEEPRDIDYMRRRKLDTGREFAVWNFTSSTATAYARSPARQGNQASSTDNTPPSGSKVRIRGLETHPTASPAPSQSRALFQWL